MFQDKLSVPSSKVKQFLDCMTFEDGTDRYVATGLRCVKRLNAEDIGHEIFWLAEDLQRQLVCGNMFVLFTSAI